MFSGHHNAGSNHQIEPPRRAEGMQMERRRGRLNSFTNWRLAGINIDHMVNTGFYMTGRGDEVKCYRCGVRIGSWEDGDVPAERHRHESPHCRLVRRVFHPSDECFPGDNQMRPGLGAVNLRRPDEPETQDGFPQSPPLSPGGRTWSSTGASNGNATNFSREDEEHVEGAQALMVNGTCDHARSTDESSSDESGKETTKKGAKNKPRRKNRRSRRKRKKRR